MVTVPNNIFFLVGGNGVCDSPKTLTRWEYFCLLIGVNCGGFHETELLGGGSKDIFRRFASISHLDFIPVLRRQSLCDRIHSGVYPSPTMNSYAAKRNRISNLRNTECNPHFVAFVLFTVLQEDAHNHMPDDFQARRGLLLKHMHRRIESDPTLPVRRTYDEVICIDSDGSDEVLPTFDNVRSRLKRYRSRFMPPIPTSMADVNIRNEWKKTWKGEKFLTLQDNNLGVVVFATKK